MKLPSPDSFDNSKQFIVAEVSKSWKDGHEITDGLVSQKFEGVIEVNLSRGYGLHSWQLVQTLVGNGEINETIIAVFQKAMVPKTLKKDR